MSIFFDSEGNPWKITAHKKREEPLKHGWYEIEGDDLDKIAITGDVSYNIHLLPEPHPQSPKSPPSP